jgi:hypothetical protein
MSVPVSEEYTDRNPNSGTLTIVIPILLFNISYASRRQLEDDFIYFANI